MQIELGLLAQSWALILGLTLFTVVARSLAVGTGLALLGTPVKDSLRTGLSVTPIGEFSFIIAQLGVGAALLDRKYYPVAVGVALLTTLVGCVGTASGICVSALSTPVLSESRSPSGVAAPVLQRFVNGERGITLETAGKLATYLGLALLPDPSASGSHQTAAL